MATAPGWKSSQWSFGMGSDSMRSRVHLFHRSSFRGASEASEPGIHNHRPGLWIPCPALTRRPGMTKSISGGKPEMHHVAVGDQVFLAFEPHLAGLARARLAAAGNVIAIADGLGADKTMLEIRVDDAGRLRRLGAFRDGPGTRLLRPGGEIGHQMKQRVAGTDQAIESGLFEPDRFEIIGTLLRRQRRDFRLYLGGNHHSDGALLLGALFHLA